MPPHGERERKRKLAETGSGAVPSGPQQGHEHQHQHQQHQHQNQHQHQHQHQHHHHCRHHPNRGQHTVVEAPLPPPPTQDPRSLYGGHVQYTSGEPPVPVRHSHHAMHGHRRQRSHQEGPSRGFNHHHHEVFDRPGKRHQSKRNDTLEEILSDGELSDTGADVGEVPSDAPADQLSRTFNAFNAGLSNLLSIVDSKSKTHPLLDRVLGRERSSFVKTMKAMELEGTLPWLAKPRVPSPERASEPSQIIYTTSGITLEPIKPRKRAAAPEEIPKKGSGAVSVRSVSSPAAVPPVPFSAQPIDPVKRAKIWPPELPPIKNEDIRKQVFSHKSIIDGASSMIGEAGLHNERLEFLGDSYLGAIVTRYIFARFPTFREGAMTNIRSGIVGNKNLYEWCVMYKLEKNLITGEGKRSEVVNRTKTLADLFEAYVGGLLLDSGPQVVDEWLKDLIEPMIKDFADQYNKEKPLDKSAKNELQRLISGKDARLTYEWEGGAGGNQGGYVFAVHFTGWGINNKVLGKGWGPNKTDATIRAAMNVLAEGTALAEVKRAKQRWYDQNPSAGSQAYDAGLAPRYDL